MITKLFDTVVHVSGPAVVAAPAQMLLFNLSGGAGSIVFPSIAAVGQCIGVQVEVAGSPNLLTVASGPAFTGFPLQYAQDCALFSWDGTVWQLVSRDVFEPAFRWTWADATARQAQAVDVLDVGDLGYQTDMDAIYRLAALSGGDSGAPTLWARVPDEQTGVENGAYATPNTPNAISFVGMAQTITAGSPTARGPTDTTNATSLGREANNTAAAVGSIASRRGAQATTGGIHAFRGWRQTFRCVINDNSGACVDMRWFCGTTLAAITTVDLNPNTFTRCLGIGRTGSESTVQFFHNDNAGLATVFDLGASFPHGMNEGYELELFTRDGTSYSWQVTNINTGVQVSGVLSTDVPEPSINSTKWTFYASNNTTGGVVSLDLASTTMAQYHRSL